MILYGYIVFLHLAAMAFLFMGYGLEWTGTAFLRKATTAQAARSGLSTYRVSLPMSGPALLVLILSGGFLAGVTGASKEGWILGSVLGIVVALFLGFGLVMPRMKRIRAALPAGDGPLGADALDKVQDGVLVTLIRVRAFIALGIVYLMTLKPPLVTSVAVLFGAVVLGILFSAGAWSKPVVKAAA
jgi:Predicted integral membrane protein (DUF2269)